MQASFENHGDKLHGAGTKTADLVVDTLALYKEHRDNNFTNGKNSNDFSLPEKNKDLLPPLQLVQGSDRSFGTFMDNTNRAIDEAVAARLRENKFQQPDSESTTGNRAAQFTESLAGRGDLRMRSDEGFIKHLPGMDDYNDRANNDCVEIDKKERALAQKKWDSLPESERTIIEKEKSARDLYESQTVYRFENNPPATPHLKAFEQELSTELAPLERQRQATLRETWKNLPNSVKEEIFRGEEKAKKFRAL